MPQGENWKKPIPPDVDTRKTFSQIVECIKRLHTLRIDSLALGQTKTANRCTDQIYALDWALTRNDGMKFLSRKYPTVAGWGYAATRRNAIIMAKFKRKLDVIAILWDGKNIYEVLEFTHPNGQFENPDDPQTLIVETELNGKMKAEVGDWIVKTPEGLLPLKPKVFDATYLGETPVYK